MEKQKKDKGIPTDSTREKSNQSIKNIDFTLFKEKITTKPKYTDLNYVSEFL